MKSSKLNLFDLTMIIIGLVIGMGIFRTATDSAKDALNPTVFFCSLDCRRTDSALRCIDLCRNWVAPSGYRRILQDILICIPSSLAFSINCLILVSNAASLSGVALIGAGYISRVIFHETVTDLVKALIAMAAVIIFLRRQPARSQNERTHAECFNDH